MFSIAGVFLVIFVTMFLFIGTGLLILAYFNLAPMPVWMKKWLKRQ